MQRTVFFGQSVSFFLLLKRTGAFYCARGRVILAIQGFAKGIVHLEGRVQLNVYWQDLQYLSLALGMLDFYGAAKSMD